MAWVGGSEVWEVRPGVVGHERDFSPCSQRAFLFLGTTRNAWCWVDGAVCTSSGDRLDLRSTFERVVFAYLHCRCSVREVIRPSLLFSFSIWCVCTP